MKKSQKREMLAGARKEFLDKKPQELAVQTALVKKVCEPVAKLSEATLAWMNAGIDLANDWREVGIFYNEIVDSLPGKKMTVDFFRQLAPLFVDKHGNGIAMHRLEWAGKMARLDKFERIKDIESQNGVPAGFNVMLSYRQAMLGAAGFFELEGERQPQQAHEVNYYLKVLEMFNAAKLRTMVEKMEADPNLGKVETWPAARKEKFRMQIKPWVDAAPAALEYAKEIMEKLGSTA